MKRAALALLMVCAAAPARAERHLWFGAGTATVLPGSTPGGWFGGGVTGRRLGVRADSWIYGFGADHGEVAAQLTWTGGRTGRHLVIDLRGGVGARWPDLVPVVVGGVASRWGLQKHGPLFLGVDGGVHLTLTSSPSIAFVSMLALGLHW